MQTKIIRQDIETWDEEMLRVEFAELADDGFNLELTGFELGEITNINLDGKSLTNDDDFKEVDIEQMECIFHNVISAVLCDLFLL